MRGRWEDDVLPRLDEVEAWARNGVCEKDIAHNRGIAYSTFKKYKGKYEALSAVLARTRDYVDNVIVVSAYLRRITGYDAVEVRREYAVTLDEEGNKKRKLIKETEQTKHIPGDPRAAEFWLSRRQGKDWPAKIAGAAEAGESGGVIEIPAVVVAEDG